jgi:hypothetical protein
MKLIDKLAGRQEYRNEIRGYSESHTGIQEVSKPEKGVMKYDFIIQKKVDPAQQ